jgi:hypothetical protein
MVCATVMMNILYFIFSSSTHVILSHAAFGGDGPQHRDRRSIPRRRPRCTLGAGGPPRVPPPPAGAACSQAERGGARSGQAAGGGQIAKGILQLYANQSWRLGLQTLCQNRPPRRS